MDRLSAKRRSGSRNSRREFSSHVAIERCLLREQPLEMILQRLLFGLAQHLIPAGITPSYLRDLAIRAFVGAAAQKAQLKNGRVNISQVAVITSLRRAAVTRLLSDVRCSDASLLTYRPKSEQVVAGWRTDPLYVGRDGKPRRLSFCREPGSFVSLVKKFAGDVPPQAVLAELHRSNLVRETTVGLKLVSNRDASNRDAAKSLEKVLGRIVALVEGAAPISSTADVRRGQAIAGKRRTRGSQLRG